ncbi:MAG TPA: TRAP transporter large permease subunit [Candidatus Lambdaproteobacteria bacterium]|nr:TRAP transporter large permease subunit [Candidatus Lambdaproteobacteria bacterium]
MELMYFVQDHLPLFMFAMLGMLLFTGYPVAFILGGVSISFGLIGFSLGVFSLGEFFNFAPRIWGFAAENLVLVALPTFIVMGITMERSGIAEDLLHITQILLRKVPGGLAMSVTVMGTILAAMTGIIGASVTMMTAIALPTMLKQKYYASLATGVICAAGTLGILIPPSIMLIIMGDLLQVPVGTLFMAALGPGLILAMMYMIYIGFYASYNPEAAPRLTDEQMTATKGELPKLILRGFLPPVALIFMVKGSILFGFATPSEAGAVGAFGAFMLAVANRRMKWSLLKGICESAGLTIAMIFMIIVAATCFAYVFRSLGGDYIVEDMIAASGLSSWGLLGLIMFVVFFLGFFLDWVEITLIVLPIFAPMVAGLDFGAHVAAEDMKVWFLVLVAVNLQTSFLTPPFGFAIFYLKGIAPKGVHTLDIYRGIIPFVIIQVIGLLLVIALPEVSLWLARVAYD